MDRVRLIELPKISDPRGNLTFVENSRHVPFEIKRVFFLYDIPTAADRGAHAHKKLEQVIICLSGSFDVALDNGKEKERIHLNRPWHGLYVPPMVWASEINFDPGSVCLVLASDLYDEAEYYRNYNEFIQAVSQ